MNSAICNSTRSFRLSPALAALLILGTASASRADFEVRVYEDGNVGSATLFNLPSGGTINLSGPQAGAPHFDVSGFTVTSNSNLAAAVDVITSSGTIKYLGTAAGHTLTIQSSDTTFTTPAGGVYVLNSSESYTEVLTKAADSYKFQSFADPGDVKYGAAVSSPGFTFGSLGGTGSDANNENSTNFSSGTPLSISHTVTYFATSKTSFFQPTGSTTVSARAVPEPGSLALLGVGLLGAGIIRRRRTH